jgi:hypothetical protein
VPWIPELFSAPALAQFEDNRRGEKLIAVNYFAGLMTGEVDALIDSFAGEPELHHVRGESGKLAAPRIYDDSDPPLGP